MLSDEAFQKLLFDLFCLWHDVRRHYDPPITHTEEEKMQKVKQMICKLLGEIDSRVKRIIAQHGSASVTEQDFIDEWTMLAWNVLCITSRLQNSLAASVRTTTEDRVIFSKLNGALVELVNHTRTTMQPPAIFDATVDQIYDLFTNRLAETMNILHGLYRTLKQWRSSAPPQQPNQIHVPQDEVETFALRLQEFGDQHLAPFVDMFKAFCNEQSTRLWHEVRQAQIARMANLQAMPAAPVEKLVSFYSHMMYRLAILSARLQGFRYELAANLPRLFGDTDPVQPLSDSVFSALELLMSDCVLATEPSTNPILVTNNLFQINCGALARGVVFKQFDIQVIGEEQAEHVQSEMRSQRLLQQPTPIGVVPSAALLAMKPTSGVKRDARNQATQESQGNKKSDVNSKEVVTIYPVFNSKNRYWAASYPHMLCTTRQKGGRSTNNSFQDLSPSGSLIDSKSSSGKRPIFYFHISATMFSPSGQFADAHTLSLPLTIATRRNQDCQVQRMMSSYTATCFWLYGCNVQDGLLLQWIETGMSWEKFKLLFMQHFKVNADVQRGLQDRDFDLLQFKIQCHDCIASSPAHSSIGSITGGGGGQESASERTITFKNMLCPHLRYECGSTNVRFSVWRGMLEVLQLFQDAKTNVRKLWEKGLIMGFLEFDQVDSILSQHQSALIMRLSFVTGGTVCITVKSLPHAGTAPMHLEPLDLKKLQNKCLKDYLRDICMAEKVKYIINSNYEPIRLSDVVGILNEGKPGNGMEDSETSRKISSNVTHSGDIDAMQHITFTAMRIAVVTCKVKPPSADIWPETEALESSMGANHDSKPPSSTPTLQQQASLTSALAHHLPQLSSRLSTQSGSNFHYGLPAQISQQDDFIREVIQLCRFHGKSKAELVDLMERAPEDLFAGLTLSSTGHGNLGNNLLPQPSSTHGSMSSGSPYGQPQGRVLGGGQSGGGFLSQPGSNLYAGADASFLATGGTLGGVVSPTTMGLDRAIVPIQYTHPALQQQHQAGDPMMPNIAESTITGLANHHYSYSAQHSHETSPTLLYDVINEEGPIGVEGSFFGSEGGGEGGDGGGGGDSLENSDEFMRD